MNKSPQKTAEFSAKNALRSNYRGAVFLSSEFTLGCAYLFFCRGSGDNMKFYPAFRGRNEI